MIPSEKFYQLSPKQRRKLYVLICKQYIFCPNYPVFAVANIAVSYTITPQQIHETFLPLYFGFALSLIFWWVAEIIGRKV